MPTKKETSFDEPSTLEKIIVATNSINWMATRMNGILSQFEAIPSKDDSARRTAGNIEASLLEAFDALREVAEGLGNYMDGHDMGDKVDEVYTTPAFDIMYDRLTDEENED